MEVIKRDGTKEEFNGEMIAKAVGLAGGDITTQQMCWAYVHKKAFSESKEVATVQEIEQCVIERLEMIDKETAKRYKDYAEDRKQHREKDHSLIDGFNGIVYQTDEAALSENSNKASEQLSTQRDLLAGVMVKHHTLKNVLPKHVASAHNDGTIHVHDTDYIGTSITNCCLVDLENMLKTGFTLGNASVEQPKSIQTATAITAQLIAQVASSQYGGTTIPDIDTVLEPYVMKSWDKHYRIAEEWVDEYDSNSLNSYADKMTIKEIESAFQGLEYEINTLHTSNG